MKNFNEIHVLLFGSGGRQVLPMAKGFYAMGCKVTTYAKSKLDLGYLTRYKTDSVLYTPPGGSNQAFMEHGAELIKSGKYDLVVPMGDGGAEFLAARKEELKEHAVIAVNDWDIFKNVIDKQNTMKLCQDNGISCPITIICEDPAKELENCSLQFPVVVKPRTACGSVGFNIIRDKEALKKYLEGYDNRNGKLFVQEYIPQDGPQYCAEMFRDREGNFTAAMICEKPRWFPLDGGSATINITVHDKTMVEMSKALLDALGWKGYANIDFVVDCRTGQPKVIEVNGRISAIVKLSYLSGIDVARMIIENEFGMPVTAAPDYEDGIAASCLLPDLLWLLKCKDRKKANPRWSKRWAAKDIIFSVDDPLPTIGFIGSSLRDFKEKMNKRKRVSE